MTEYAAAADMPGAMDAPDTHYTIAQFSDCKVFHIYVGELPPGSFIGRSALCGVNIVRLAHPTETERGTLCRRCERSEGP
jgi:hypothetical protein